MPKTWTDYISQQKLNLDMESAENIFYPACLDAFFEVSGPDALKFLQGQLTCDVSKVTSELSSIGSHCNAKGRMQSSFRLFSNKTDGYIFSINASIQEQAISALQKYIVFSKANINKLDNYAMIGLQGENIVKALAGTVNIPDSNNAVSQYKACQLVCTDIASHSYELIGPAEEIIETCDKLAGNFSFSIAEHHKLRLNQLGQAFVDEYTINEFTPQSFNYQCLTAVSFDKGCYTGQEIVARLHYLGKLKRNMFHFKATTQTRLTPGMPVSHDNKTVGHIISAVETAADNWDLLINIENSLLALTELQTESGDIGNLEVLTLPYEISE